MKWAVPLAERIEATGPIINARSADDYLRRAIRPSLLKAANEGRLAVGDHEISRHVQVTRSKDTMDASDLVGGRYNQDRDHGLADLRTADGGWLFFLAVLRPHPGGLEVLAYDIERVFGPDHRPAWVRFDLNPRGHANDVRGLRSHFHADNDDLQLHAPIFAPHELIELFLGDLGPQGGRKPRAKGFVGERS
jgi:hypothetical protein